MNKSLLLSATFAIAGASLANAHEFKNEKLKNFYGNARVTLGYQLGMNEGNISRPHHEIAGEWYTPSADGLETHKYDMFKKTHHSLSVGVDYNFYYRGFSKKINPFVGARANFYIPLSTKIYQHIGYLPKEIYDDATATDSADNMKKVDDNSRSMYNILSVDAKIGTKIQIRDNIAIEPFIGYGKTLSNFVSKAIEKVNDAESGRVIYYINDDGETINKMHYARQTSTLMSSTYSVGADVVIEIKKQTIIAGLEYKFIDFNPTLEEEIKLPKHYLNFKIGYQFM